MLISSVNSSYASSAAVKAVSAAKTANTEKAEETVNVKTPDVDTFVRSGSSDTETKRLSADQIRAYQEQRNDSFSKMINDIVSNQANQGKKAELAEKGITKSFFDGLVVTPEQQMAAQQAIGEDGEWGVNAVATRIVDMCVALSGGDASKVEELRAAVDKGFQQATGQWGSSLPSICDQTHAEINKRFDYWKENGSLDGYAYQRADVEE